MKVAHLGLHLRRHRIRLNSFLIINNNILNQLLVAGPSAIVGSYITTSVSSISMYLSRERSSCSLLKSVFSIRGVEVSPTIRD